MVSTAQTATRAAGTVMAEIFSWDSVNGRQRCSPPVRVSTRSPPSSGIVAPNSARAATTGVRVLIPRASQAYGTHEGDREHEQRLGEAQQALPLPPDQGLPTEPLPPTWLDGPDRDGAPLDDDVASQTEVESEEGSGDASDQGTAAGQPGPTDAAQTQHREDQADDEQHRRRPRSPRTRSRRRPRP